MQDFDIDHFEKNKPDTNKAELEFEDFKFQLDWDKKQDNNEQPPAAGDSFFTKSFKDKQDIDLSLRDFADPEDIPDKHSQISRKFNAEKSDSNRIEDPSNKSRYLDDIPFNLESSAIPNQFVFTRDMPAPYTAPDDSYQKLRKMVKEPKPKPLTDFFKELSESAKGEPNDSFLKRDMYSNREEFEEYLRNLKLQKRLREEQHMREEQIGVGVSIHRTRLHTFGIPADIEEMHTETLELQANFTKKYNDVEEFHAIDRDFNYIRASIGNSSKKSQKYQEEHKNSNYSGDFKANQIEPSDQDKIYQAYQIKNPTLNTEMDKGQFDQQPSIKSPDPFLAFDFGISNSGSSFKKSIPSEVKQYKLEQKNVFGSGFGSELTHKLSDSAEIGYEFQKKQQVVNKFNEFDTNFGIQSDRQVQKPLQQYNELSKPIEEIHIEPLNTNPMEELQFEQFKEPELPFGQKSIEQMKESKPHIASVQQKPIDDYFASVPDAPQPEATPPLDHKTPSVISDHQKKDQVVELRALEQPESKPQVEIKVPSAPMPAFGAFLTEDMINNEFDEANLPSAPVSEEPQQQPSTAAADSPSPFTTPSSQPPKSQTSSPPKPIHKLDPIREQNSNIFQKTIQQQKLSQLFQNYERLRHNFDSLMGQLKSNSEGQQKLITELSMIKHDFKEQEEDRVKKLEEERRQKGQLIDDKQLKILELKKELEVVRQEERRGMEKELSDRIVKLEGIVRRAFEQSNATGKNECMVWVNPEASRRKTLPQPEDEDHYSENVQQIAYSRRSPQKDQEICSPLQLRHQPPPKSSEEPFPQRSGVSASRVHVFSPRRQYTSGEQFIPRPYPADHFFRMSCTQEHTAVYESFDFFIGCRYSSIKANNRKVLKINVSIRNKTIMTLQDIIVIVYGCPQEALSVNPAKIFAQRLCPDQSLGFEVYLSNIVLESQHITMQMSFKAETLAKRKLQVMIPRPLVKFFDVQFTHEEQFKSIWEQISAELYVEAKLLNFKYIRSSEDLRVILPFIELTEEEGNAFSYGLLFRLFAMEGMFLLKLLCTTDGKASLHLRYEIESNRAFAEEILNTLNCILFL